jgi:hypothetical protein
MPEDRETMMGIPAEVRAVIAELTTELRLFAAAFTAMRTSIEQMLDRDLAEESPNFTCVRKEMN